MEAIMEGEPEEIEEFKKLHPDDIIPEVETHDEENLDHPDYQIEPETAKEEETEIIKEEGNKVHDEI